MSVWVIVCGWMVCGRVCVGKLWVRLWWVCGECVCVRACVRACVRVSVCVRARARARVCGCVDGCVVVWVFGWMSVRLSVWINVTLGWHGMTLWHSDVIVLMSIQDNKAKLTKQVWSAWNCFTSILIHTENQLCGVTFYSVEVTLHISIILRLHELLPINHNTVQRHAYLF